MTEEETKENPAGESANERENIRDIIREELGSILPDFLKNEEESEGEGGSPVVEKSLSAKDVESIIRQEMASAMKVLQAAKPKPAPRAKEEESEGEKPEPKNKAAKEEPPATPQKKYNLSRILWGE